jgi:hypothetical protein
MAFGDRLESLIEKAVGILNTEENVIRDEFTRFNTIYVDNIKPGRAVAFELQPTLPAIAKALEYDLERFFQDRDFNFEKTLEYRLWHREHIPDDSPFIGVYEMDYACHSLEYSMFGIRPRWTPGETPSYGLPIVQTRDDLKKLAIPDFSKDGFMPRLIDDYHRIRGELKGRLEVGIRKSVQGPYQTATGLRGQENVFMEQMTDPGFVKELMEIAFEFHKAWAKGWEKLHSKKYGRFNIGDDDIDTRFTVPPKVYRSLILPMHKRYGEQFKSIHWHSCGDTNAIFTDIATIPGLELLEVGPKDDIVAAAKLFAGSGVKFYKCPDVSTELDTSDRKAQVAFCEAVLKAGELVPLKVVCEADNIERGMALLSVFREIAGQKQA